MNKPFNTPPNAQRLFDLLHIDKEMYRPAFYYALRDTLVASNLDVVYLLSGCCYRRLFNSVIRTKSVAAV